MELFKLFGKIAVDNNEANNAIDETTDKAEKSESKIGKALSKVGSGVSKVAVTAAKVGLAATTAAATGIGLLTKSAIQNYAEYEQLVGGVETLFGTGGKSLQEYAKSVGKTVVEAEKDFKKLEKSQADVLRNADKAYKTAGMSANEYMETVTSFSASLLQSLEGDTEKAAEAANMAVIDMSDNANKMGTSMESIQNAYQGFAKQNYTMLDNLKLGYGGTKEEMQRLLDDASKLSGIEYDLSSFGDIVDAIHVVQDEMGITGTTAKEAASTIQGSIGTMKAAWTNFLTGMSDPSQDFGALTDNLIESVVSVADNIVPRLIDTVPRLVHGLSQVAQKLASYIPDIVTGLVPPLITGAVAIVSELASAIPSLLNTLIPVLFTTLQDILSSAFKMMQGSSAFSLFKGIFSNGFIESMQEWIPYLADISVMFAQNTYDMFAGKIGTIKDMFVALGSVLQPLVETVLTGLMHGIENMLVIWNNVFVPVLSLVIDIFSKLVTTIATAVSPAIQKISVKFQELQQFVSAAIQNYILPAITLFIDMIRQLWTENQDKINALGELFSAVFNIIAGVITWFVDVVVKEYLYPIFGWLYEVVSSNMDNIKNVFQSVFDIIGGIVSFFTALFMGDWQGMWDSIKSILQSGFDFISGIFGLIKGIFESAISSIWEKISSFFEGAKQTVVDAFENIKNAISVALMFISELFSAAFQIISIPFNFIWENCKEYVFAVFDFIKEKINTALSEISTFITEILTNIYNFFSSKFNEVRQVVETIFNAVYTFITSILTNVYTVISSKLNEAYTVVSTLFTKIKDSISSKLNEAKAVVVKIFTGIKDEINGKIEAAKDIVSKGVQKLKDLFNFEWKLPKIKLPHFTISGSFSLDPPSVPSFGIEWYKKAMDNPLLMTSPTAFGINSLGQIMAGGEAGSEVVSGTDTLMNMISQAVSVNNAELINALYKILDAIIRLDENTAENMREAMDGTQFTIDKREFARLVKAVN